jgi:hypothetical protein
MASNVSTYLANKLLDHSLGKTAFTMPSNAYLALYTAAPNNAGGGTEVSGNNYSRVQLTAASLDSASSRTSTNNTAYTFPTASGSWGTIVALGIVDASTNGNLLWWGDATTNQTIGTNNIYTVPAGELDISFTS